MNKILNLFVAPAKVFITLKEKPNWALPLILVLVVLAVATVVTVSLSRDTIMANQEERMRERGMTDEQIEQAMKFMAGPFVMVSSAISVIIITSVIFLIFSLLINILIPVFGGTSGFGNVFSVVCFASLVKVPASILRLVLVGISGSPFVSTSLSLLFKNPSPNDVSFAYRVLSGVDFFMIWEMILVSLGISITSNLQKKNAYIIVFLIWIVSIFLSAGLGFLGPRH